MTSEKKSMKAMGEIWSRRGGSSAIEVGRVLFEIAQSELDETRQRQYLSKKHNDMLDLIAHSYLSANEAVMDYQLPEGLRLSDVRDYLKKEDNYSELRAEFYSSSGYFSNAAVDRIRRGDRRNTRKVFVGSANGRGGDTCDLRWQILFHLTVMGALGDSDLSDDHRQILDQTYIETQGLIVYHLPWLSRQTIFRDYPFIHPDKGWSPFRQI